MIHVAIIHRPHLDAIVAGAKHVESRLTKSRRDPFGRVAVGDWVFFKQASGAFRAAARVSRVVSREGLVVRDVREIRREFGDEIAAPAAYWRERSRARYATLMWLGEVHEISDGPDYRGAGYRSQSAWHVLDRVDEAQALATLLRMRRSA
ncbi:MAG: hypothetical protein IPK69_12845 [Phycisphaerales bacterium]|nr:MAG: hypothetical protein IPK69_12845 [Phycisphaerales bacterium]